MGVSHGLSEATEEGVVQTKFFIWEGNDGVSFYRVKRLLQRFSLGVALVWRIYFSLRKFSRAKFSYPSASIRTNSNLGLSSRRNPPEL
jgi:hypothetical protein